MLNTQVIYEIAKKYHLSIHSYVVKEDFLQIQFRTENFLLYYCCELEEDGGLAPGYCVEEPTFLQNEERKKYNAILENIHKEIQSEMENSTSLRLPFLTGKLRWSY